LGARTVRGFVVTGRPGGVWVRGWMRGVGEVSRTRGGSGDRPGAGDQPTGAAPADVQWLLNHLRGVVAASSVVWAGRGMTLRQIITVHLIGALAPIALLDLAEVLGTRSPATSAMVDRLAQAGLVSRVPDPQDGRRVQLALTTEAASIIGETNPDTARRLHAVLRSMSPQIRRHVLDVLRDGVRRSST
jgi:DNA-binding MarR family transcriptional regulator